MHGRTILLLCVLSSAESESCKIVARLGVSMTQVTTEFLVTNER